MTNHWSRLVTFLLLAVLASRAPAQEIIMTRSMQPFPETMLTLQESIRAHGYTVSRVQRIDIGLTGMGYKTDKYRIVFAGKPDEIRMLTEKAPQLIPYMPPKISIFAEGNQFFSLAFRRLETEQFAQLFTVFEIGCHTFLDKDTEIFPEGGVCFRILFGFFLQELDEAICQDLAELENQGIILQGLAGNVKRQVFGVNNTFQETQPFWKNVLTVLVYEDFLAVEIHAGLHTTHAQHLVILSRDIHQ